MNETSSVSWTHELKSTGMLEELQIKTSVIMKIASQPATLIQNPALF